MGAHLPYAFLVFLCFAVDRLTKWWVENHLHQTVELIPFLNLTKVYNTGFLFGLGREWNSTGKLFFYLVIPTAVLFIFAYLWFKTEDRLQRFALSLVIGGSLGNLTDRLVRGKVPDFIDLHAFGWHYPAFNVADICITVGVIFLLISILKPLRGN